MSKYAIGERWYCDRSVGGNPYNRPAFYFVIAGKSRAGHKMCRLEKEDGTPLYSLVYGNEDREIEYSHKHLKKYAVHVPKQPKEDA